MQCSSLQLGVLVAGVILLIMIIYSKKGEIYSKYKGMTGSDDSEQPSASERMAAAPASSCPSSSAPAKAASPAAPVVGKPTQPSYGETDLEGFLGSSRDADKTYNFEDPMRAAHGQYVAGEDPTSDPAYMWDPAEFSLEGSVYDSHREFVKDAYVSTQGPNNKNTVRDDTNEINPRVGLRRVDYTDLAAQSQSDARVVSSEYPEQIAQPNAGTFLI